MARITTKRKAEGMLMKVILCRNSLWNYTILLHCWADLSLTCEGQSFHGIKSHQKKRKVPDITQPAIHKTSNDEETLFVTSPVRSKLSAGAGPVHRTRHSEYEEDIGRTESQ